MNKIKNTLFLFILICIAKLSTSQPYQSIFGKNLTTWSIYGEGLDEWGYGTFYAFSDTVFNSLAYKRVYNFDYTESPLLLREDSVAGKVWIVNLVGNYCFNTSQEKLVLDMSLQVGDTFNINFSEFLEPDLGDTFIIVDSVYYVQGQKRIRFATPSWVTTAWDVPGAIPEPITFIEGIGPNYSPLWINDNCDGFNGKYLLCVFKDSVQADYTNLHFNGVCYPGLMGVEDVGLSKISISPNPAANQLLISANDFQPQTITIYNLNGQQLINLPFARQVDISTLPPGVYFVEVTGAQGTEVRKLVKIN